MFMVLSHLDPHHSSVLMQPTFSLTIIKSWEDGLNISVLFLTILYQPMIRQFNAFHKFQSIMNLMYHPSLVKLRRPLGSYQMARCLGLMLYQPKSINMVDLYCARSWMTSSSPYGQQGTVLQDFKDALIIHLSKRKGNCQQCDNHCSISLLSITGKVLARALLNCLTMH